ncbi:aminoacyl-tRNA hydrolase [Paracoccus jiaweipingae]|uniref:aminoacyl-tRNA hydrolase n=1 Tax=unclassified Paracoccus (in: a-proteobacteria) TaxID=2688777 RepID=UPI0037B8145D
MKLIVGLGNPGGKYEKNRHNIGFMALDRIAADHAIGPWKPRFSALMAEGRLGSQRVALLKPQTFMNLSGQSVGEAMRYLRLTPDDVVVLHDELDLAPGKMRVKTGGGHAGHNGLRSIHQHIGAAYHRVRLGVGHPGDKNRVSGYVLSDFAKSDADWLDDLLRGVTDGAARLAAGDWAGFANAVAARTAPARNSGTAGRGAAETGAAPRSGPDGNGGQAAQPAPPPAGAGAQDQGRGDAMDKAHSGARDQAAGGMAGRLKALAARFS